MATKEAQKQRYYDLKGRGLCPICGVRPPREGKVMCKPCALRKSELYYRRLDRDSIDHIKLQETEDGKE